MKDSPAEKAGFKTGDIVFSVGNNFSKNIQAYKTMLQNIGGKIKVIIMRDGSLIELSLKVRRIF
jgi:C-terminal processing protease CtpA/Prc